MSTDTSIRVTLTRISGKERNRTVAGQVLMPKENAEKIAFEMLNWGLVAADAYTEDLREFRFPVTPSVVELLTADIGDLAFAKFLTTKLASIEKERHTSLEVLMELPGDGNH